METLRKFKQFVDEINLENGRNYKISILEKYKNDEDIKYYLHFVFSPYIVTGISDKKLNKYIDTKGHVLNESIVNIKFNLERLKECNTGSDFMISQMQWLLAYTPAELQDLLYKIITKNLILGIDAKTINKVMPKLIETFNVMLANKYFDKSEIVEGKTFALTTKIDGMRCIMMKENGNVTFWSRQGQPIEGLVDLQEDIKNIEFDNFILDGELVAALDNPDTYKETMKRARNKDAEKHGLKMLVFDYMPVQDFKNQNCDLDYTDRQVLLEDIFNRSPLNFYEKLPLLYCGKDTNKIIEFLTSETAKGEEGIMINIVDAPYEFKRSNVLLKVKKFQDIEVKIIGFEVGTNKNANTLGNLICDYKGYELRVGSGFKDEERDYIWTHQDEYLGQYAKVKYFEETSNANGGLSLRFPTYLGCRLKEDM